MMSANSPSVAVYGPAYLDRVLMVDRPLRRDPRRPAIDRSAEASSVEPLGEFPSMLVLEDGTGRIRIDRLPMDWPGPTGRMRIAPPGLNLDGDWGVEARAWHDDLGGMGAGYARALGGTLHPILGDLADPSTVAIERLLNDQAIRYQAVHGPGRSSDWTLLVSSGPHGDKLPLGFRGACGMHPISTCNPWKSRSWSWPA
ncbi:MAG: hypothetical protein U0800_02715 [Isosphaeraceae bacterium]